MPNVFSHLGIAARSQRRLISAYIRGECAAEIATPSLKRFIECTHADARVDPRSVIAPAGLFDDA
jgi:aspartate oxidase